MPALTPAERVAGVLLALQALGVAALVVWEAAALAGGDTLSVPTAIALLVVTGLGAVAMGAFAFAVLRDESWGRSGGIVLQLLLLAVALGAATGTFGDGALALALAAPALLTLVLLILSVRAAAARHPRDDAQPGA
ncbi:histidine kinase [Microbacterium sp. zg.Y1090]|uniref:histidine kinase n=1 Tax=Microbacterium TaxID=33882 RepID=UPI00214ACABA|nr:MULTISPECIES: histidine kinase [unclassified Microbacterium]MCR2813544.1 histidine kinase [Microbacterium sp. zg.Y1084]MCR2818119.1 histidine kinase [Microbacterium sp. zg.Y1090]MDL5486641.1 histidine kinase [Microbacterium sp. zg-Y1211]WIM27725.1 histidine kinase [Microbacterium sp. zg-Y1090]